MGPARAATAVRAMSQPPRTVPNCRRYGDAPASAAWRSPDASLSPSHLEVSASPWMATASSSRKVVSWSMPSMVANSAVISPITPATTAPFSSGSLRPTRSMAWMPLVPS